MGNAFAAYEKIDQEKLAQLSTRHAWIVEPIFHASSSVLNMPFFSWVKRIQSPQEFGRVAVQLYYHSATFPKAMGLMLAIGGMSENYMMTFYSKHAFNEADHHEMLMKWMLKHGILSSRSEINTVIPTIETNACVNYAYQMALEQDRDKWLVGLNSGIERCSNDFFRVVAPKLHSLGAGDEYFDVHVEADEHHSIMGLEYVPEHDPNSFRGRQLIIKALEGISLWAAMLHSWIGIDLLPKFDLSGNWITLNTANALSNKKTEEKEHELV
ncbi:MAG: iron-containing redox enzyme family protein [Zoogloeaceae bacterium]|jgi:pyrroloquinoline quinone (PQQ) biosynthesis protein C|nr:iron-containing redox enzyme family protein [Zoogloeaceae bacterium]